jgi:hypothetical protein
MGLVTLPNRLSPAGDLILSPARRFLGLAEQPRQERAMARDVGAVGTETDSVREQIERAPNGSAIRVGEYDVVLTDLDRILWPAASGPAVTKRDFLRYLVRVAPVVLPFLRNRPVEVTSCPNGIDGESVFELDGVQLPPFAQTVPISSPWCG